MYILRQVFLTGVLLAFWAILCLAVPFLTWQDVQHCCLFLPIRQPSVFSIQTGRDDWEVPSLIENLCADDQECQS